MVERAFSGALTLAPVDEDEISVRILDAAFAHITAHGFQRATMDEIARRAGVARITVYRRFATRDVLVERVCRREFQRYFGQFLLDIARAQTAADRVVAGFVSSVRTIRANPFIRRLLDPDDDAAAALMVSDHGRTLDVVRQFVAAQLRREQAAGTVAAALDVDRVAEVMVRIAASFLIFPSHVVDLDDDAQLAGIARDFLVPMLDA